MRNDRKRDIWERCLLAAIANGKSSKNAAEVADGAVAEYSTRFSAELAAEEAKWEERFNNIAVGAEPLGPPKS